MVKYLLDKGALTSYRDSQLDKTALEMATDDFVKWLIEQPSGLTHRSAALHHFADTGHLEAVNHFVEDGALDDCTN